MTTMVEINAQRRVSRVVPVVSVAGVGWPVDKIALVLGTLLAVMGALVVSGSAEIASWAGIVVGLGALVAVRIHYALRQP
ncbi:hypothetical protein HH308_23550 [Gordonia sp. TBRC 11910]|uniref:Uncharacterized protein n=1 Tax=Gordonia asplenii TaxID=2725283 RepID=A0A848L157_9ACTN|nr:hypothetical protein [Gordonia asplenii]NMO04197.1 hypothetical protein [Gordonia asplenii]